MLDVDTEKGRIAKAQETRAIAIYEAAMAEKRHRVIRTIDPARVDGIIFAERAGPTDDDKLKAIAEIKSRPRVRQAFLKEKWDNRWLVTAEKIRRGIAIAEDCNVPFIGLLYLPEEDLLMVRMIFCPGKGVVANIIEMETETQATVNGGRAVRLNAYIDMTGAKTFDGMTLL